MPLTQKQIEERQNYIGGSEVGSILCVNPYDSPYDVWEHKVDGKQKNISNAQVYWGHLLEPVIRDEFDNLLQYYTDLYIRSPSTTEHHKKHNFLAGNVDGLICQQGNSLDRRAILEIKTVSPRMRKYWGEENHDLDCLQHRVDADKQIPGLQEEKGKIPDYHYAQCAFYMMLYDLDTTYLAAFFGNEFPWQVYKIERDHEFEKFMLETLINFWQKNVLTGIPPHPINAKDIIKIYPRGIPSKTIIATNEIVEKSAQYKFLKSQEKQDESDAEKIKGDLKFFMKDAGILVDCAGNRLQKWSRSTSNKFQQKLFKEKEPEMHKKYCKDVKTERFT